MANQRQGVPAGWTWRANPDGTGRPRWIPSPVLRKAGWKGTDLRDPATNLFLARGPSITAAEAIVQAVADWRAGKHVSPDLIKTAPAGACGEPTAAAPRQLERLSVGALADAWAGNEALGIKPSDEFARLKPKTQSDYRGKLKRLLDCLAGHVILPHREDKASLAGLAADVAKVRAWHIATLAPRETPAGIVDPFHRVYWALHNKVGLHQASGVLTVASVWLEWCHARQSRTVQNWAKVVDKVTPPGRVRAATWEEFRALVLAADKLAADAARLNTPEAATDRLRWLAVGDAIVLAFDLGWSEVDILALPWNRLPNYTAFTGKDGRIKTGNVGGTPLTILGERRLDEIRARQAQLAAHPTRVIHLPRHRQYKRGEGADSHYFRKLYPKVRDEAAKTVPSVAGLQFADLRDTAFTFGKEAGLSDPQTGSRSLHSQKTIKQMGDRHYGETTPEIANQARERLNAYIREKGLKL